VLQVAKTAAVKTKKAKRSKSRNGKVEVVSFPRATANPVAWQYVRSVLGPRPDGRAQVHADGTVTIHNNPDWTRR
jgi:hypothetical protein